MCYNIVNGYEFFREKPSKNDFPENLPENYTTFFIKIQVIFENFSKILRFFHKKLRKGEKTSLKKDFEVDFLKKYENFGD